MDGKWLLVKSRTLNFLYLGLLSCMYLHFKVIVHSKAQIAYLRMTLVLYLPPVYMIYNV